MSDPRERRSGFLSDPTGVDGEIDPKDFMYNATTPEAYHRGGSTALRAMRLALLAAEKGDPRRILDLPSGYGRVMRYMRAAWPGAEIVACDLLQEAVEFCAMKFGAVPVTSTEDPAELVLPGRFDLIWCGSLLTHLPVSAWGGWMQAFERVTEAGDLLLFSVHGRYVEHIMRNGGTYQLSADGVAQVLAEVDNKGSGYANYTGQTGYGISLTRAEWVIGELLKRGVWQLESYSERALNEHQDIVVARRV
ncbi:MAG: class I SAM-dependent methyltransferase [Planctomycetota bacterium]|jgi:SAM-dependent methyltransferase